MHDSHSRSNRHLLRAATPGRACENETRTPASLPRKRPTRGAPHSGHRATGGDQNPAVQPWRAISQTPMQIRPIPVQPPAESDSPSQKRAISALMMYPIESIG